MITEINVITIKFTYASPTTMKMTCCIAPKTVAGFGISGTRFVYVSVKTKYKYENPNYKGGITPATDSSSVMNSTVAYATHVQITIKKILFQCSYLSMHLTRTFH